VIRVGERHLGLAVDSLAGFRELAVKRLNDSAARIRGIAAAGVPPEGEAVPILDVIAIAAALEPAVSIL
ncbi:MAG: chemotaxis protein CheW, partial [Chloroflexi bacterium]|nr:chemotaxis protein CheW [Chloroflexota bacterium]